MKIIFVYNANSGITNSILDIGHKILSPNTYACNLCNITFGRLSEKEEWKKFRESSDYNFEFLHKDEFEKNFDEKRDYPLILKLKNGELTEVMKKDEIDQINTLQELIQKIKIALQ